ncbi:hypothetical protein JCM10207_007742 [Rhodosporidiobolus poonsookiae]
MDNASSEGNNQPPSRHSSPSDSRSDPASSRSRASQAPPKRGPVACRLCSRAKKRCYHSGVPPCEGCIARGLQAQCILGKKGKAAEDRAPKRLRMQAPSLAVPSKAPPPASSAPTPIPFSTPATESATASEAEGPNHGVLPPLPLLFEACQNFFELYLQVGFTHRPSFFNKLGSAPDTISTFFLLAMLSVSARYTLSLIQLHNSAPSDVSAIYMERACRLLGSELVEPTLERVQALYMLGLCDLGSGNGFRAKVLQSLARQMAELLKLDKPVDGLSVVENETRRRTWWILTFDSSLKHAVGSEPSAFDPLKVPIPLPLRESDFTNGIPSKPLVYFPGSRSAIGPLVPGHLSQFGALVYIGRLFASALRAVCSESAASSVTGSPPIPDVPPWEPNSFPAQVQQELQTWLAALAPEQKWSTSNLLARRALNLDFAFYNVFVDFHSIQMLTRRTYLPQLIRALAPSNRDEPSARTIGGRDPPEGIKWFERTAEALIMHAFDVFELTEKLTGFRPCDKGITPHLAFCIYLAGSIANYLRLCPWLSPGRASDVVPKILLALSVLEANIKIWPIIKRWHQSLSQQASVDFAFEGLASSGSHAELSAEADLRLDREQGLYRHYSAASPSTALTAGRLDAASTLASLARPLAIQAEVDASDPTGTATVGSLSCVEDLGDLLSVGAASDSGQELSLLDFGDLTELNAYFGNWGAVESPWTGLGLDGAL